MKTVELKPFWKKKNKLIWFLIKINLEIVYKAINYFSVISRKEEKSKLRKI